MSLYLVQHGIAYPKDIDSEQSLTEDGIEEIKQVAKSAALHEIYVSMIKHSGKKRALQSAEIFANILKPPEGVQQSDGLNPLDNVIEFASSLINDTNVMIVGHLPFLEKLTSYLIIGNADKKLIEFRNAGIVCLDQNPVSYT